MNNMYINKEELKNEIYKLKKEYREEYERLRCVEDKCENHGKQRAVRDILKIIDDME